MRSVREENIMEHSQQVAMLAHALAIINNKIYGGTVNAEKAALLAIYHECPEVLTGDLPTPVKYLNKSINVAYKDIEDKAVDKLLSMLPKELTTELAPYAKPDKDCAENKIVKAADRLSAYIKCLEERRCGNDEFIKAEKSIKDGLLSRNMPEVNYFLEHFIPAFLLTLDDLNGDIE